MCAQVLKDHRVLKAQVLKTIAVQDRSVTLNRTFS